VKNEPFSPPEAQDSSVDEKNGFPVTVGYEAHRRTVALRKVRLRKFLQTIIPPHLPHYTLEIGCGHGDFLVAYGKKFPSTFGVGIDRLGGRLEKCERKRHRLGLNHLVFVRSEANEFLECCPKYIRFGHVFILYPDPWPKRRHADRRLFQPSFLKLLERHVLPFGKVFFRTDNSHYYSQALRLLTTHHSWILTPDTLWPCDVSTRFAQLTGTVPHNVVFTYNP
jgi:tRNA (guanine-N7-)-methyltransferase